MNLQTEELRQGRENQKKAEEATLTVGKDIFKKMKVGDTVLDKDGKKIAPTKGQLPLDGKAATRRSNGSVDIQGENFLGKEINFNLSKEEVTALRKWL